MRIDAGVGTILELQDPSLRNRVSRTVSYRQLGGTQYRKGRYSRQETVYLLYPHLQDILHGEVSMTNKEYLDRGKPKLIRVDYKDPRSIFTGGERDARFLLPADCETIRPLG